MAVEGDGCEEVRAVSAICTSGNDRSCSRTREREGARRGAGEGMEGDEGGGDGEEEEGDVDTVEAKWRWRQRERRAGRAGRWFRVDVCTLRREVDTRCWDDERE